MKVQMKNNKGITLTSIILYLAIMFVVLAIIMRITTYFSNNISDVADVTFEAQLEKINIYFLDEAQRNGNGVTESSDNKISFTSGNSYTFIEGTLYLNNNIKICEDLYDCTFSTITAENGKTVVIVSIATDEKEETISYVMVSKANNNDPIFIGEGDYIIQREDDIIDDEYQQVEYIESTGTQYINTGYLPDANTNARYKVSITSYATYGPHLLSSKNYFFPFLRGRGDILSIRGSTEFTTESIVPETDTIYEIEAFWNGKIIINGEKIGELTSTGEADTTPLYLGTYGGSPNNSVYILNGKIYYCKIYNEEELVRDYVPCYRISDNVAGLYDKVEDKFYENAGTGSFIIPEE